MTAARSIALRNPGTLADEFWVVHYVDREDSWDIREIEIYWDAEHKRLKSDDNPFDSLSVPVQTALLVALNEWLEAARRRRRGFRRLMFDLRVDPAVYDRSVRT